MLTPASAPDIFSPAQPQHRARTRREFATELGAAALGVAGLANLPQMATGAEPGRRVRKKIAAVVTHYTLNSHADVLVSRLFQGHMLNGTGAHPDLELVSLFVDQYDKADISQAFARKHGFRHFDTIAGALTLGGKDLAVDGVLLIGEHGIYPLSATGQIMYPRRRFFAETAAVFRRCGRSVPVFSDKHLAWNWADAKWMYDTAQELKIPMMAGSSIPVTWRRPAIEATRDVRITEAVGLSYGPIEGYGYHALEGLQCLVERRRGGETGVAAVQMIEGPEVYAQRDKGRFSQRVFDAALHCRENTNRFKGTFEEVVRQPAGFFIEYRDGLRAVIIHDMRDANNEWIVAWDEAGKPAPPATLFWTQEARPMMHFGFQLHGIEAMIHTGKPAWPVERTLLTTGILAALFESRQKGGIRIATPHLAIAYQPTFTWTPVPPPPPSRPFTEP
ncbi:hypothetical protein LBMAG56_17360 [Verrucomicrobiota bacterium]|nr:hypothetical protein LBMAG56_17360 [Verrucomicrobiota bacterium]